MELLIPLADKVPKDNDVVAGWGAFGVFVLLCLAVAFLGFSLVKHLRRARENFDVEDESQFKDSPERREKQR